MKITTCIRVEDASTLLRMERSVFDIIIIEQCLLGVNEFELLQIGREMDLPVIVTFKDGQPNIVQWSLENGTCEYQLKLISMSVLNMVLTCMFFKKENKWAQVQQPTNNASRVRNQRMSWTPDSHEKFVESVQKLGGVDNATPKKILQLLQSNFKGFEDVDSIMVSSHLQKYRKSLKEKGKAQLRMLGCKDKDGTSSEHIQSRCQMEDHIQTHNFTSMIQKLHSKVPRIEDELLDKIMNTTYQLDLSSSPQQLATAVGNMCLQPNVGTQVLQNIQLPLSSDTIEETIIQDQALVANVAGKFSNTSLSSSSQYKAVDANETAMPGNGPNYFTRPELPEDALREIMNTTYPLDLSSSPQQLATSAGNM